MHGHVVSTQSRRQNPDSLYFPQVSISLYLLYTRFENPFLLIPRRQTTRTIINYPFQALHSSPYSLRPHSIASFILLLLTALLHRTIQVIPRLSRHRHLLLRHDQILMIIRLSPSRALPPVVPAQNAGEDPRLGRGKVAVVEALGGPGILVHRHHAGRGGHGGAFSSRFLRGG
jgi:hypothetical protein